jgi:hypothetical protein
MWTRRLLLATLVAGAAMMLPRHVPASSWTVASGYTSVAYTSFR